MAGNSKDSIRVSIGKFLPETAVTGRPLIVVAADIGYILRLVFEIDAEKISESSIAAGALRRESHQGIDTLIFASTEYRNAVNAEKFTLVADRRHALDDGSRDRKFRHRITDLDDRAQMIGITRLRDV